MIFNCHCYATVNNDLNVYINNNNGDGIDIPLLSIIRVDKISKTPAIKFLGIYLDLGLTFQFHLRSISSKISSALHVKKSVKKVLPQSAFKTLYFLLIHCHFLYGINIWSAFSKQNLNSIFLKQKAPLRTICEAKYNAHTEPLFKSNGILPLDDLISYYNMLFTVCLIIIIQICQTLFKICGEEIFLLEMQIMLWLCATIMIFTFLCSG